MAVMETEDFVKEMKDLSAVLASGPKLLRELPKGLQAPEFLEAGLAKDRIQVGRPDYSYERVQTASEEAGMRPIKLVVAKTINWTSLKNNWEKTIYELLQGEDEMPAELRLRVRLARRG